MANDLIERASECGRKAAEARAHHDEARAGNWRAYYRNCRSLAVGDEERRACDTAYDEAYREEASCYMRGR